MSEEIILANKNIQNNIIISNKEIDENKSKIQIKSKKKVTFDFCS